MLNNRFQSLIQDQIRQGRRKFRKVKTLRDDSATSCFLLAFHILFGEVKVKVPGYVLFGYFSCFGL